MNKKLKFSIIFNANAAGGRKLKLINKVIELLKIDHSVELFKTSSEKDAEKVFSELSKNNTDRVVIAGNQNAGLKIYVVTTTHFHFQHCYSVIQTA